MTLAVISDIHGNGIALRAVLDDLPPDVDLIVCAGDVVGYGPSPAECVDVVRDRAEYVVEGNHEATLENPEQYVHHEMAYAGLERALDTLSADQLEWATSLPTQTTLVDDRVLLCHGHPDPERRFQNVRPQEFTNLRRILQERDLDFVLLGHTHVQHAEQFDEGVVVNPGSVGQPRDGNKRAAYAVIDTDDVTADLHRVEYDVSAVRARIEDAGLPEATGARLEHGRVPDRYR